MFVRADSAGGGSEGGEVVDGQLQRGDGGVGLGAGCEQRGRGGPGRSGTCDEKNMDSCRQDKLISSVWVERRGF